MAMEALVAIPTWFNDDKGSCTLIIYTLYWMHDGNWPKTYTKSFCHIMQLKANGFFFLNQFSTFLQNLCQLYSNNFQFLICLLE
jgi:hypothetical protein